MKNSFTRLLRHAIVLTCICFFSFCTKSSDGGGNNPPPPPPPPPPDTTTYQLVWSDEFDGDAVNTANWNFETGNNNGWGNHEEEYYQAANATIENDNLVITAKKEAVGGYQYTSSRMTTQGKKEFKYGRIEARIKLPVGQGFWPAFWMLGANIGSVGWPACGETDIMEHINTDNIIYGTIHYDNNGHHSDGSQTTSSPAEYHVYSVEWTNGSIKWSIDSVEYYSSNILGGTTDEFHLPFFIILNLAIGGDWPGQAVDESFLPAKMYVDYVRVYQKK